ncbi:MAG: hypothetical protein ACK40Y_04685 [Cloacibacterium caeni]
MKNLFLTLATTIFIACNQSDEVNPQYYNIEAKVEFSLINLENEDLLNPENPNHLDTSKLKIYYVKNEQSQEVNNSNSDYPKGFRIYKHEKEYRIAVFLNHSDAEEKPITYIKWNDEDTDTIKVAYQRSEKGILQNIIWLNGNKVWERGNNTIDPYFVLEK